MATNFKNQLSKAIGKMPDYFVAIPLDEIFAHIEAAGGQAVQEDGTPWSGFLCGESGQTTIAITGIKGVRGVHITWYKTERTITKWEVIKYIC